MFKFFLESNKRQLFVIKRNKKTILSRVINKHPYFKVVGSLYVCLCVCVRLNNSGTTRPIWLFFFVSSILITGWFSAKRIPDPESTFSGYPEKNSVIRVLFDQFC